MYKTTGDPYKVYPADDSILKYKNKESFWTN